MNKVPRKFSCRWSFNPGALRWSNRSIVAALGAMLATSFATAQQKPHAPLATKQQIIQDRLDRLEDQMYRLIEKLQDEEPEHARRLRTTLKQLGELGIRHDLTHIIEVLNREDLELALEAQKQLLGDLASLLTLLIEDPAAEHERQEEIERLEELAQQLNQLIAEQARLEQASQRAEQAAAQARPNPVAAAAIQALMDDLGTLREHTRDKYNDESGALAKDQLAARQQELHDQAEPLAEMLAQQDELAAAEMVRSSKMNMNDALQELSDDAFGSAGDAQEDALADLARALERLSLQPAENQDPTDFEELAAEQDRAAEQTKELAEQMSGDPQENQKSAPGQENVAQSAQHMDAARQNLTQENPGQAQQQQKTAREQLEQALERVQQEIQQLKVEAQQQKLADLEAKFNDILIEQRDINRRTAALNDVPAANWGRAEQLQAVELGDTQHHLGDESDDCLAILTEDGTTTVLPQLARQLRDEMYAVAGRLKAAQLADLTQRTQQDIVATLQDILSVIEQSRQQQVPTADANTPPNQQQQDPTGDPPLLPTSAELRLLSTLQQRVFRNTRQHHRAEADDHGRLQRIAARQADIARLAAEMQTKLSRPAPTPPGAEQ